MPGGRTPWGEPGDDDSDTLPGPPPLRGAHLQRYVLIAGLAAVATVLALAFQAIDGGWVE